MRFFEVRPMMSETVKMDLASRIWGALIVGMALFTASPLAGQNNRMNFFVAFEGATWGANRPPVGVSDAHCTDLAYPRGFGHLHWRAYLTGTAADGEEGQSARARIGEGPWYNFHGVEIAADLDQLHSSANNLTLESAVTVMGEPTPDGVLEIPPGSQLDGSSFTREGPFFCFGVP
jgi:hypothetical protein